MTKFSELPPNIQREIELRRVWFVYPPNHEQILQILPYNGIYYHYLPKRLQTKEYLLLALPNWSGGSSPLTAPGAKPFHSDREVIMTALKFYGRDLASASEDLRRDDEIIRTALANDDMAISAVPYDLRAKYGFDPRPLSERNIEWEELYMV